MLILILITIIIAKHNKLGLRPLIHCIWLLPAVLVELIYIVFQISVLTSYYGFIPYASLLKSAALYVFILPVIRYKLYKPALWGSGLILIGTLMNEIVIRANGGFMPVYATISRLTGYYDTTPLSVYDKLHCIGNAQTKLKFLSDYIDLGFGILSPGDLLVHSFTIIILYATIKQLNHESIN